MTQSYGVPPVAGNGAEAVFARFMLVMAASDATQSPSPTINEVLPAAPFRRQMVRDARWKLANA